MPKYRGKISFQAQHEHEDKYRSTGGGSDETDKYYYKTEKKVFSFEAEDINGARKKLEEEVQFVRSVHKREPVFLEEFWEVVQEEKLRELEVPADLTEKKRK